MIHEVMLIMKPTLTDDEQHAVIEKHFEGLNITKIENWGVKALAYEMDGFNRGAYYLVSITGTPSDALVTLDRNIKLDVKNILRHLIIRKGE